MSQNIVDFCEENRIKWFPINLEIKEVDGEIKKILHSKVDIYENYYITKMTDFKTLTDKELRSRQKEADEYEYIALDTNDICQLDIDSIKAKDKFKDLLKDNPYYLSATKKMPHIFCKINKDKYPKTKERKYKDRHPYNKDDIDIDILTGQWAYVKKDMNVINPSLNINDFTDLLYKYVISQPKEELKEDKKEEPKEELKDIKKEDIKKVLKEMQKEKSEKIKHLKDEKEKKQQQINQKKQTEILEKIIIKDEDQFKELKEYLECLSRERFENYDNWMKLTTIVKSNYGNDSYDIFDLYCKKYKNYNKIDNKKNWDKLKSEKISLGTLLFWCKEDNFNKYSEIILNKYKDLHISDKFCCEILQLINDNIIWKDGILYYYDGKIWTNGQMAQLKFKDFIDNELYDYINLHILSCHTKTANITKLISQLNRIQTQKGKNEIIETSKQPNFKFNKDNDESVIFDKDWEYFPMKSKVYNLLTEKFVDYKKDMYITNQCGYDYIKPTEQKVKDFNELLNKIFVDESIKEKFLMICSTGLENRLIQKIHFFTGCGGNGKSLLCDYLSYVFTKYYKLADTEIITLNGKKDDVKLAEISNKRIIMFPEPDKTQKINAGIMRKITGEKSINARFLYQNKTDNKNVGTYIVCSNSMPALSAEPEIADARRFEILPFKSLFTTDDKMIDEKNNIFKADISLLEKGEYFRDAFLNLLLESHKKYKKNNYIYNIIEEGEELKKKYFEKSMTLINFLNEYYDMTDNEDDVIKFCDLYNLFKNSEFYRELSKDEKRRFNRNGFIEYFESNIYYKSRFVKKHKILNQSVLIKLKEKDDDGQIEEVEK